MCFSVRKSKVQHVDNICPLIISAHTSFWSSSFLTHYSKQHLYLKVRAKSVSFLSSTCCVPGLMKAGEMSGNLQHFLFVKGQHLFPKITAWRCPFPYACTHCWMLGCSEPQWWFPSNLTLCALGFRFSQVIFCFWTLRWVAFICRLSPNTSLSLSQNFCQSSPPLLWLQ